jgi:hypothetical protein
MRLAAQWIGLFAGPLAWAALLETNYVLSYVACEHRQTWMLDLSACVALALVAAGAVSSWRAAPPSRSDDTTSSHPVETAEVRARFMATGGLVLSAWFALVILATEIPALVLHPCTP